MITHRYGQNSDSELPRDVNFRFLKQGQTHLPHKPVHGVTQIFGKSLQFGGFFWLSGSLDENWLNPSLFSATACCLCFYFHLAAAHHFFAVSLPDPTASPANHSIFSTMKLCFRNCFWLCVKFTPIVTDKDRRSSPQHKLGRSQKKTEVLRNTHSYITTHHFSTCLFSTTRTLCVVFGRGKLQLISHFFRSHFWGHFSA